MPTLDQQIDELDALIPERDGRQMTDRLQVPVLDEPAEPDDATPPAAPDAPPHLTPRQLVGLSQRLQQRIDAELGDLTEILRGVLRRCIQEELRRELPPAPGRPESREQSPATAADDAAPDHRETE